MSEGGDDAPATLGVSPEAELRTDLINRSNGSRRWTAAGEAYKFLYMPLYIAEARRHWLLLSHGGGRQTSDISCSDTGNRHLGRLVDAFLSPRTFSPFHSLSPETSPSPWPRNLLMYSGNDHSVGKEVTPATRQDKHMRLQPPSSSPFSATPGGDLDL